MLTALSVRNIVLIDQLDLGLDDGLTVLTGETGAGKSILLDALALALGGAATRRWSAPGPTAGRLSRCSRFRSIIRLGQRCATAPWPTTRT